MSRENGTTKQESTQEQTHQESLADFKDTYRSMWLLRREHVIALLAEYDRIAKDAPPDTELDEARANLKAYQDILTQAEAMPESPIKAIQINGAKALIAETQKTIQELEKVDPTIGIMMQAAHDTIWEPGLLPRMVKTRSSGGGSGSSSRRGEFNDSGAWFVNLALGKDNAKRQTHDVDIAAKIYLVGPNHPKISDAQLAIAQNRLGVFDEAGVLQGQVVTTEKSDTAIIASAIAIAGGYTADHVADIQASGYGTRNCKAVDTIPELKAGMTKGEQMPTAGSRQDTEVKQPA